MPEQESEIEILPDGRLRISRLPGGKGNYLLDIIKQIVTEEEFLKAKKFLEDSNDIELIKGKRILCG